MKNICLYFHVHQPILLKTYSYFEIGKNHLYFDDENNRELIRRMADRTYLPANKILLDLIKKYNGRFRISFSISGTLIFMLEKYAPDVIRSFRELAETGCVEFLSGTHAYSLASLANKEEFVEQVKLYEQKILSLFGMTPTVFANTELIYSDDLGEVISELGYKTVLVEGSDQALKQRSPNYIYRHPEKPQLSILMNNFKLSEDIKADISENISSKTPMYAENFLLRYKSAPDEEQVFNIMIDYETFVRHHDENSCMIEFLNGLLPIIFCDPDLHFCTPSEITENISTYSEISIPDPVSWSAKDEGYNQNSWNDLQIEAFNKLYALKKQVKKCRDSEIMESWQWLQSSDYFFYMSSIWFENTDLSGYFTQYESPYIAYINYINILNDFTGLVTGNSQEDIQKKPALNKKQPWKNSSSEEQDAMLDKKFLPVNRLRRTI